MAMVKYPSLSYAYRSRKEKAFVLFRFTATDSDNNRKSFYSQTDIEVEKSFFEDYQKNIRFKDNEKFETANKLDDLLNDVREFVFERLESITEPITVDWFKNVINDYYTPQIEQQNNVPTGLIPFFDFFLNEKTAKDNSIRAENIQTITNGTLRAYNVVRNKLEAFQDDLGKVYEISDINVSFLKKFQDWSLKKGYANSVINKNVAQIKMICNEAKNFDIEVDEKIFNFIGLGKSLDESKQEVPTITLSFDELEKIQSLELDERLDNVRDWLIISCYTGQRISDFKRFNTSMIVDKGKFRVLSIKQQKTKKEVTIPLMPIVEKVLKKRDGQFPEMISDQKYNDAVKEVCRIAGLDQEIKGKISEQTKKGIRRVIGVYPKWMLITSHIGRRSFATNYYGVMHTAKLKDITGHSTEAMLLTYIGKKSDAQVQAIDEVEYNNMINV